MMKLVVTKIVKLNNMKQCPECNSKDPSEIGTSYTDSTKSVDHPYFTDHMNAHICSNKWHYEKNKTLR